MAIYLAYFDPKGADHEGFEHESICKRLADGLYFVETSETRSRLYHRIKRRLANDAALLVAPLEEAPKFKSLEAGAMKWIKGRFS